MLENSSIKFNTEYIGFLYIIINNAAIIEIIEIQSKNPS